MRRATTPTHSFNIPTGLDTDDIKYIRISYEQGPVLIVKDEDDVTIEDNKILVRLEQTDTVRFKDGTIAVQLRIVTNNGDSIQGKLFKVHCEDVLNDEVLV